MRAVNAVDAPSEIARRAADPVGDVTDLAPGTADDADELGDRLLAAAAEVFAERGYDKAGVAEIARRAGVTTGAIYGRYPGKAELLVEAIDPHAGDELDALFADHHFVGRMQDILLAAGSRLIEPDESDLVGPSLLLESFVAARRHPDVGRVLRARVDERQRRLTEIVELAKADGGIDAINDTASLVTFCHALGFGFLLLEAIEMPMPDQAPWGALIARMIDALGAAEQSSDTGYVATPHHSATTSQGEVSA